MSTNANAKTPAMLAMPGWVNDTIATPAPAALGLATYTFEQTAELIWNMRDRKTQSVGGLDVTSGIINGETVMLCADSLVTGGSVRMA